MSMCTCDYDKPSFFSEVHHTARKTHRCSECGRHIQPGERYAKVAGKWDGRFGTFRRCSNCESVANALKDRLPCYCDMFGGLWETISDGYMDDLLEAETGDYFAVMRLIAAAERARMENPWKKM